MSASTVTTPAPPAPAAAAVPAPNSDGAAARLTLRALTASLLGALPLLQLLTDGSWLVQAWISMAIVIVPAALLRLRWTPSVLHLIPGLVLLVGYLTRVYLSGHAWFGVVPTRASWGDFRVLSSAVGSHDPRQQRAPALDRTRTALHLAGIGTAGDRPRRTGRDHASSGPGRGAPAAGLHARRSRPPRPGQLGLVHPGRRRLPADPVQPFHPRTHQLGTDRHPARTRRPIAVVDRPVRAADRRHRHRDRRPGAPSFCRSPR